MAEKMQTDDAKSNFCNFDRQSIPHGAEKRKSGFLLCKTDLAAGKDCPRLADREA